MSTTTSTTTSTTSSTASTASTLSTTTSTHSSSSTTTTAPNTGFCLFRDVTIPEASKIIKAVVEFTGYAPAAGIDTNVLCHFEDGDNPSAPPSKADLDGRLLTSGVPWKNIKEWKDNYVYQTPQLATILQSIINRSGWASGNNILFLAMDDGSSPYRLWSAMEHKGGTEKARLRVSWIPPKQVETPLIEPVETFQVLTFDCSIRSFPTDVSVYYTIDGSDPDENSTLYSTPFAISVATTVKARAYKQYWLPSDIASRAYTFYLVDIGSYRVIVDYFLGGWGAMYYKGGYIYILYVGTSGTLKLTDNTAGYWASATMASEVGPYYGCFALDVDDSGYVHAVYHVNIGGGVVKAKYATNSSGSWVVTTIGDGYAWASHGGIFKDSSGYIHCFYHNYYVGNNYVVHATNASGSWGVEYIDLVGGAIRTVSAIMFSDDTFALCYRGQGSDLRISEGSWGSWSSADVVGSGLPFIDTVSIASYVDGSDNAYFCYSRGSGNYSNDLYIIDNEGVGWSYSLKVECSDLREAGRVRGLFKDSSGYFHIIFTEQDTSGYIHTWYATNDSGSWVKLAVGEIIGDPNSYEYPLFNAIAYDEVGNKLYSVWRKLTEGILLTLDK